MEVILVSYRAHTGDTGQDIPYLLLSMVNIASILLISVYIMDVPIMAVCPAGVRVLLFALTALALGLLISSISNSQQVAMLIR